MGDEQEQFGTPLHAENRNSLKTTYNCLQELFHLFFMSDFLHIDRKSIKFSEITYLISYDKAHQNKNQKQL